MYQTLLVGIGGSIGAMLRYLIGTIIPRSSHIFPWSTFIVNVAGSFLLGLTLFGSGYKNIMSQEALTLFTVGVLGAFTTMSTFSYESIALFEQKEFTTMAIHIIGTLAITLLAVYAGKITAFQLWKA